MIKKWKFISRELLLDHPRMKVVEDIVELPNGKKTSYIRKSPTNDFCVSIIAINNDNKILLQQEYSYPPNEIMYQFPGGMANENEDIIEAANRELSEESGYIGNDCVIIGSFYVNNRRSNLKQYIVVCKKLKRQKIQEDDEEFIEDAWLSYDEIKKLIIEGKVNNINLLAALQLYDVQYKNRL